MKFEDRNIVVGGKKVFYVEKNSTRQNTVVILHGFPGTHEAFVRLVDNMGENNWRFIIPDLPACGLSQPLDKKHNLENYSDWLNEFLQAVSVDKAVIIGHSFGARVALVFAGFYPKKVDKLVLITPMLRVDGFLARIISAYYQVAKTLPAYLQKIMMTNGFGKKMGDLVIFEDAKNAIHQEIIARDIKEIKKINPKVTIELFNELLVLNLIPLVEKIHKRSLIIAGERDEIAPLSSVRELASHLPESTLEIMKNGGHLLPLEQPESTAEVIKNWLGKKM